MIKAIIFDCDGLLVDTESVVYQVYYELYREHDVELPLDLYVQCVGGSIATFDPYVHLANVLNKELDFEKLRLRVKENCYKNVQSKQLLPGVKDYLQEAKSIGLKIGLASSSNREWVMDILNNNDILHYFDAVFTRDNVKRVKPDPDLYDKSLESLGVKANEAIIFEDSLNGLTAAKAAGAYCVVVPNEITRNLPFEHHDLRLKSMADLCLSEVIDQVLEKSKEESSR
ncbi:HAD family hydrolase [bacterium LRH843]|nr:HAD family hydrolase [bacterium LRH843]